MGMTDKIFAVQVPKIVQKQRRTVMTNFTLSPCALKFALACIDPFDPRAFGVCNPAGKQSYTQKCHTVQRITAVVGSFGLGFIALAPCLANNTPNCYYSTASYDQGQVTILSANNTLATGVTTATANTPYGESSFTETSANQIVSGRMVSAGLRATYTGTTLNESGMYYALTEPQHGSVTGMSQGDIGNYQQSQILGVNRNPLTISSYPLDEDEDQPAFFNTSGSLPRLIYPLSSNSSTFSTLLRGGSSFTLTVGGLQVGTPISLITFTGVPGSTFQVDVIQHMEFTGQLAQTMLTRTAQDPVGANTVRGSISETEQSYTNTTTVDQRWSTFWRYAGSATREFTKGYVSRDLNRLRIM